MSKLAQLEEVQHGWFLTNHRRMSNVRNEHKCCHCHKHLELSTFDGKYVVLGRKNERSKDKIFHFNDYLCVQCALEGKSSRYHPVILTIEQVQTFVEKAEYHYNKNFMASEKRKAIQFSIIAYSFSVIGCMLPHHF
jgi:hypothetical protein